MKWIYVFLLLTAFKNLSAQDCPERKLAEKPGKWVHGPQGSIHNIAAADLAREKLFLNGLQKKIASQYAPEGLELHYSTVWNKTSDRNYIADPYHLAIYLLRYLCDDTPKGFYVEIASATNITIAANQLFLVDNMYAAPLANDDFRGYIRLFTKPEKKNGAVYMGTALSDNGRIKEETWLITRGDSLPFHQLNRKEFLLLIQNRLQKKIQNGETDLQQYLDKVNEELQQPLNELLQPAVCNFFDEERFSGFLEEGDRFAFYPGVPDLAYYRNGLPKSAAQFISVNYKYSVGNPTFDKGIQGIQQALTFDYLRSLLPK